MSSLSHQLFFFSLHNILLASPVQKIRKLPLGTQKCPLCIPIPQPLISLWLCRENDLFLQETSARSPETLLFDFLHRFFRASFAGGGGVEEEGRDSDWSAILGRDPHRLPFRGRQKKSFVVSLNFVTSVTSISKDPSLGGNFAPGHKREPAAKPEVALRRVRVKPH